MIIISSSQLGMNQLSVNEKPRVFRRRSFFGPVWPVGPFATAPGDPPGGQLLRCQGGSTLVPGDGMGLRPAETWLRWRGFFPWAHGDDLWWFHGI